MHDLDAPGAPGGEQLVRVDLVDPTEEVAFGVVVCRPIDGSAAGVDPGVGIVAALERRLTLLDRRSFGVPFAHPVSMRAAGR